jgi:hypothetical protein
MSEHIWMEHAETGHRVLLPDLPYWRANGWEPCDGPPPEPDVLHDPVLHDQPAEQDEPPAEKAKPAKKTTAAKSAKPAEPEES